MGEHRVATGRDEPDDVTDAQRIAKLIVLGRDREAAELAATPPTPTTPTPTAPTRGGAMDVLSQLDEMGPLLMDVVGSISPDQLDDPTPCARYTVRGVLAHMVEGATTFTGAFGGTVPAGVDASDVLAAFPSALGALSGAIHAPGALERTVDGPFGRVPGETFARFVVLDGLVHGWDLATATGRRYDPPDTLVADVQRFAEAALDGPRDGERFADPVVPPASATPMERLAAFTGRRV